MKRAIIRVTLPDIPDEKAVEVKKKIEELVKDIKDKEVELTLMGR